MLTLVLQQMDSQDNVNTNMFFFNPTLNFQSLLKHCKNAVCHIGLNIEVVSFLLWK